MERGPGVHSPGGACMSAEGFSLLYPHLKCILEKDSANWLGVGGGSRSSEGHVYKSTPHPPAGD